MLHVVGQFVDNPHYRHVHTPAVRFPKLRAPEPRVLLRQPHARPHQRHVPPQLPRHRAPQRLRRPARPQLVVQIRQRRRVPRLLGGDQVPPLPPVPRNRLVGDRGPHAHAELGAELGEQGVPGGLVLGDDAVEAGREHGHDDGRARGLEQQPADAPLEVAQGAGVRRIHLVHEGLGENVHPVAVRAIYRSSSSSSSRRRRGAGGGRGEKGRAQVILGVVGVGQQADGGVDRALERAAPKTGRGQHLAQRKKPG